MGESHRSVLVVGAGVSGLTTAITLAEAGLAVEVHTVVPPAETTSAAAGASWGPYQVTHKLTSLWSEATLERLRELATDRSTGVRLVTGIDATREPLEPPSWAQKLDSFRQCRPNELPEGYIAGWWYRTAVIDMPVYLRYLASRLSEFDVGIKLERVGSLRLASKDRIVVNCSGVAARDLCDDRSVVPTKGQLVVAKNPGITKFFQDCADKDEELVYILPHGDHVVLGGSAAKGAFDLEPDARVAQAIIERCARVEPRLNGARVLEHRVGVRPSRTEVRLEREGNIIHNYGHGGAGLTLSWGCAATVLELVKELGVSHRV